jgi:hypothetical protein
MILKIEIIIYCGNKRNTPSVEAEIIPKDFSKKDHDNKQGKNRGARCTGTVK